MRLVVYIKEGWNINRDIPNISKQKGTVKCGMPAFPVPLLIILKPTVNIYNNLYYMYVISACQGLVSTCYQFDITQRIAYHLDLKKSH